MCESQRFSSDLAEDKEKKIHSVLGHFNLQNGKGLTIYITSQKLSESSHVIVQMNNLPSFLLINENQRASLTRPLEDWMKHRRQFWEDGACWPVGTRAQ